MNEYMITFSSFYKAVYAQEELSRAGIRVTLKKTPPDLMRSCGYALYMSESSVSKAKDVLQGKHIEWRGVYAADKRSGQTGYR